jgi:hypothetical protein
MTVTGHAVRSYRTLSPLPVAEATLAVCFLWHFPWGRPRRVLPGTYFPWSPDFPRQPGSWRGHPTIWLNLCRNYKEFCQLIWCTRLARRAVVSPSA